MDPSLKVGGSSVQPIERVSQQGRVFENVVNVALGDGFLLGQNWQGGTTCNKQLDHLPETLTRFRTSCEISRRFVGIVHKQACGQT